jgi:Domain of unknown function (DUF4397)
MKSNIKLRHFSSIILFALVFLNACGEKAILENISPAIGARVKFIHAVPGGAPAVVIYADGKKFSGANTTLANGPDSIVYGAVFPATDFSTLPGGTVKFTAKLPLGVNPRDTTIATIDAPLENDKYYLLIAGDTLPSPKFTIVPEQRGVIKNDKKTYIKLVNTVSATPSTGYDVYFRRAGVSTLINTLKGGQYTEYIEYDPNPSGNDSLYVRTAGGTTNLVALSVGPLGANRNFAVVLRGIGVNSTGNRAITSSVFRIN